MATILHSPFFLLFCATSGTGAYLAHRLYVLKLKPGTADRCLALLAALGSLGLTFATYLIRRGSYVAPRINPGAASVIAVVTAIGIAAVCLECVIASGETAT